MLEINISQPDGLIIVSLRHLICTASYLFFNIIYEIVD